MTGAGIHDHRPRPIHHAGSCGERRRCWRPSCCKHWPEALTVEQLRNNMIIAHCHGQSYSGVGDIGWRVDFWRHGDSETWA
ncbi:hypothetical protein BH23CHL7_BH23CHL7_08300 [soil metagenome]